MHTYCTQIHFNGLTGLTENSEVCHSNSVVAGAWGGGSAHVHTGVPRPHICDDEVPSAQHPSAEHIHGLVVLPAPGDDGARLPGSQALEYGSGVQGERQVLGPGYDVGPQ